VFSITKFIKNGEKVNPFPIHTVESFLSWPYQIGDDVYSFSTLNKIKKKSTTRIPENENNEKEFVVTEFFLPSDLIRLRLLAFCPFKRKNKLLALSLIKGNKLKAR
jgi:hypothetical protein